LAGSSPVTLQDRRVRVEVGVDTQRPQRAEDAALCVIGLVPPGAGWLGPRMPETRVGKTRFTTRDGAVEHLRFTSSRRCAELPGLHPVVPTRMRDAVSLALSAGAQDVDVLAVHIRGLAPWALDDDRVMPLLDPFLDRMEGALIVLPDAGGPFETGPEPRSPANDRHARLRQTLRAFGPGFRQRFQIGLVDLHADDQRSDEEILSDIGDLDVCPCSWSGPATGLGRHGWRVASAAVAGMLHQRRMDVVAPLAGRTMRLGPGRRVRAGKGGGLGRPLRGVPVPPVRRRIGAELRISRNADEARALSEPTLRHPIGTWSLPALRTAKALHRAILRAADPFVFQALTDAEALRLVIGLDQVLRPLTEAGIVTGPGGDDSPEIDARVDRSPGSPGFVATVAAQLRPWARDIRVRVRVQPGARPQLEGSP
jgi:hypothetical protein